MDYTKLGNTDIEISKICVGCMSFGKAGIMHDWTLDEEQTAEENSPLTKNTVPLCPSKKTRSFSLLVLISYTFKTTHRNLFLPSDFLLPRLP